MRDRQTIESKTGCWFSACIFVQSLDFPTGDPIWVVVVRVSVLMGRIEGEASRSSMDAPSRNNVLIVAGSWPRAFKLFTNWAETVI